MKKWPRQAKDPFRASERAKMLSPQISSKSQIPAPKLAGLKISDAKALTGLRSHMPKPLDLRCSKALKSPDAKALRSKISDAKAFTSQMLQTEILVLRCFS